MSRFTAMIAALWIEINEKVAFYAKSCLERFLIVAAGPLISRNNICRFLLLLWKNRDSSYNR